MIPGLMPGDTLVLAAGEYPRLTVANLAGALGRCITITGPASDRPAVILGEIGHRTVEIIDSSYLVVSNLVSTAVDFTARTASKPWRRRIPPHITSFSTAI
jgi:hypothetical protein